MIVIFKKDGVEQMGSGNIACIKAILHYVEGCPSLREAKRIYDEIQDGEPLTTIVSDDFIEKYEVAFGKRGITLFHHNYVNQLKKLLMAYEKQKDTSWIFETIKPEVAALLKSIELAEDTIQAIEDGGIE